MSKKGISLVGIKDIDTVRLIRERYPDCYFELSYASTEKDLEEVLPLIKGRVASIHSLSPRRIFFPNLASNSSYEISECEILKDAELALSVGADNLILHPGYLVDGVVSSEYKTRLEQIKALKLDEYLIDKESEICSPKYVESTLYKDRFKILCDNALRLNEKVSAMGLNLCLENLNPRAGYMLLTPDECLYLASLGLNLCLDIGHLQINSIIFGFDLLKEAKRILDSGRVKSMHLHSNESREGVYIDSHKSLSKYLPFAHELCAYAESKSSNLILEVVEDVFENVTYLMK